jgi:hypothetical protein
MGFNLYIKKEYQKFIDQLIFIAGANKHNLSNEICRAVKFYVQNYGGAKPLIAEKEDWDKFYESASKEELYEMSRVICGINDKLIRKVMK